MFHDVIPEKVRHLELRHTRLSCVRVFRRAVFAIESFRPTVRPRQHARRETRERTEFGTISLSIEGTNPRGVKIPVRLPWPPMRGNGGIKLWSAATCCGIRLRLRTRMILSARLLRRSHAQTGRRSLQTVLKATYDIFGFNG